MSHDPDDLHGTQKHHEALRRSKAKSLRAILKIRSIDDRAGEIEREKRAAQATTLVAQMREERAEILMRISTCAALSRERWHARLSGIDLTSASAPAELSDLRDTIAREREFWARSPGPAHESPWGAPVVVPPLDAGGAGEPRMRVTHERSIPDVFRRMTEREHALETWRQDVALALELIVSSLHVLIRQRGSYESLTR